MHHEYSMIQVQLSLYSLDEDSDDNCETIENCIHIELVQQFCCIFVLGYNSCQQYCSIKIDASLGIQPVKYDKRRGCSKSRTDPNSYYIRVGNNSRADGIGHDWLRVSRLDAVYVHRRIGFHRGRRIWPSGRGRCDNERRTYELNARDSCVT